MYTHALDSQAGIDRQGRHSDDDFAPVHERDERRLQWPWHLHKPGQGPRGRGEGGSKFGWGV